MNLLMFAFIMKFQFYQLMIFFSFEMTKISSLSPNRYIHLKVKRDLTNLLGVGNDILGIVQNIDLHLFPLIYSANFENTFKIKVYS